MFKHIKPLFFGIITINTLLFTCILLKKRKQQRLIDNNYYEIHLIDKEESGLSSILSSRKNSYEEFYDKLSKIPDDKPLRIYVQSHGGAALWCTKICKLLSLRKNEISVYVEKYAHSAASIIALTADHLYMTEHATLSAIDPQHSPFHNLFSFPIKEIPLLLKGAPTINISEHYEKMTNYYIDIARKFLNKRHSFETKQKIINKMFIEPVNHEVVFFMDDLKDLGIEVSIYDKSLL